MGNAKQQPPCGQSNSDRSKQNLHRKSTGGKGQREWRIGLGFMKNVLNPYDDPEAISQLFICQLPVSMHPPQRSDGKVNLCQSHRSADQLTLLVGEYVQRSDHGCDSASE